MAGTKKPRKPYRPRPVAINRPRLDEALRIFAPILGALKQLLTGEIDSVQGVAVFPDWDGDLMQLDAALEGWMDCWERYQTGIDQAPLRQLAKRLSYNMPLEEAGILAAIKVVNAQQQMFLRLPVATIKQGSLTEEIKIHMDAQMRRAA